MTNANGKQPNQRPANQTGVENGAIKSAQRTGHEPKNVDLARGSEPETRAASQHRR